MIRRLPGAAVFLVEEVVQELNLTQEQVDELERIVELVGEAIQQIPIRWSHESRQQHAEKRQIVLAEARRRALEVLTEEQRACWETLQAEAAGEPGDADLVFSALPHKTSAEVVSPLLKQGVRVIDISADFRLKSAADYSRWYGLYVCYLL